MCSDEIVVVEVRVGGVDAGDFLGLAGGHGLVGVQAPNARQEPLLVEDVVQARDAALERIGRVEEGGIAA